ncbi:hypothetical protein DSTSK_25260 [Desulforhabdus sp. TSK]|nr:hypothetical protein DSTSK_25260 [Desulforhabdus sp. TSK]
MREFSIAENRMFQADGRDFIFLVKENAVYQLDAGIKALLDGVPQGEVRSESRLLQDFVGYPSEERGELLRGLVKRHILVPSSFVKADGKPMPTAPSPHPVPMQTLILQVTEACNLACRYCYYSEGDGSSGGRRGHRTMSRDVAEKGIDFLLEHAAAAEKLVLVFFGGEPLLNLPLISSAVDYAREKADEKGKHMDFALTTNGTLLKPEVIQFLVDRDIGVTVSMDGPQEIHDRNRRFRDGRPSYGAILPGLKELLRASVRKPVVARVTLVDAPQAVPDILDHLLGLGFAEVGLAPVTTNHPAYQFDASRLDGLMDQFRRLADRFLEAARTNEFLGFSNLIDLLTVIHQSEVRTRPCGAGLGLFAADPEGRLYSCQRFLGEDAFCMGNLFTGLDGSKVEGFRREAVVDRKPLCMACWARALCAGGCYYEAWVREGSPFQPNTHYCRWIRQWTELGLEVYGKIYLSNPEYLDKLALLRGQTSIFNQFYINDRRPV